jgi:hypothetical protein
VHSLTVLDVILAGLLLLVVFVNGISVGLLMVKWVVAREWRRAAPGRTERDGKAMADGKWQMGDGGPQIDDFGRGRRGACATEKANRTTNGKGKL